MTFLSEDNIIKINNVSDNDAAITMRNIIFEPTGNFIDASGQDTFELTIKKASLKNVIYVAKDAIHEKEGKEFVYLVSKDGFLDAAYIQTGEQVDNLVEIKSGLSGGEEVALK